MRPPAGCGPASANDNRSVHELLRMIVRLHQDRLADALALGLPQDDILRFIEQHRGFLASVRAILASPAPGRAVPHLCEQLGRMHRVASLAEATA